MASIIHKKGFKLAVSLFWIGLLLLAIFWSLGRTQNVAMKTYAVHWISEVENPLLGEQEITQIALDLGAKNPTHFNGKKAGELGLDLMQTRLQNHPYIAEAQVWMGLDGCLHLNVLQRKPLFRVINQQGEGYYVEKSGIIMPLSTHYAVRVPVVTGNIDEEATEGQKVLSPELNDLVQMMQLIDADPFLKALVEQVYVDKFKEWVLIPKVGNHTIVVGNIASIEDKFFRLKTFYMSGLNKVGWHLYRELDLRFKGQVVAKKHS